MTRCQAFSVFVAAAGLALLPPTPISRGDERVLFDSSKDSMLFERVFTRYPNEAKTVGVEGPTVHYQLPANFSGSQNGLMSSFTLDGDFEVIVGFDAVSIPFPKQGYGASIGVAVDSAPVKQVVSLARVCTKEKTTLYVVTHGKPDAEGKMKFERIASFPVLAAKGKLGLRREKAQIICLTSESDDGPLEERARVPCTTDVIKNVRLYADNGKSEVAVDGRLGPLTVKAIKIGGAAPVDSKRGSSKWWWIGGVAAALAAGSCGWYFLRRRAASRAAVEVE